MDYQQQQASIMVGGHHESDDLMMRWRNAFSPRQKWKRAFESLDSPWPLHKPSTRPSLLFLDHQGCFCCGLFDKLFVVIVVFIEK
jgi:hypothetical protein